MRAFSIEGENIKLGFTFLEVPLVKGKSVFLGLDL